MSSDIGAELSRLGSYRKMFQTLREAGVDVAKTLNEQFSKDGGLFRLVGFSIKEVSEGSASMTFSNSDVATRRGGMVHGGVAMYALDTACGLSVMTVNDSTDQVTLELKVNFLVPLTHPPFTVSGHTIRKGGRTVVAEGEIVDSKGEICAKALGTWYILSERRGNGPSPVVKGA
ncbi:MAG: PaaI family thioesterase [Thermoprotei archaeon]